MRRVKEHVHYFCDDTLFGHIDGHGITTAVLDTGISPHPDLEGRIVAFGDMLHGKRRMYDDNSHGTHVAGIIAGSGKMSAGNFGPRSGTVTIPGVSKKVITVGASDDGEQKDRFGKVGTNYSGRGPTFECVCKPDLVAPGSYIRSCNGFGQKKNQKMYSVKSGTSMSAPIVSGAAALLLSKYPDMKNVEVKLRLLMSADDMGKDANIQGRGLLNIEKLLNPKL